MSRKSLYYIIFFAVLAVGFYLVVRKWMVREIIISSVQPFSFTDQDGKQVTEKDVLGKVYVAEYFFTHCPGICPQMNQNLKKVYQRFKGDENFLILSHTSEPERDSVPVMKAYANSLGVDSRQWLFLTGRKDSLYNAARLSYTLDDPNNNLQNINDQFIHTQFWALVNRKGDVVRIYDGLKQTEVDRLISDIERQLKR